MEPIKEKKKKKTYIPYHLIGVPIGANKVHVLFILINIFYYNEKKTITRFRKIFYLFIIIYFLCRVTQVMFLLNFV